jgi:hypothetical protein
MDPNRAKTSRAKSKRKPGRQPGYGGHTLQPVDNPDEINQLKLDRQALPPGKRKDTGYERRKVFDLVIQRHVPEYRGERLANERGASITAEQEWRKSPRPREVLRIRREREALWRNQKQGTS